MTTDETRQSSRLAGADDTELCSMVVSGDGPALEELYDRYSRVVMSFSMRMLAETAAAEELTQEVFFRVWRQAGSYQAGRGTFATWLLSITHNMAIDELRRRKRRPQRADMEDPVATISNFVSSDRSIDDHAWISVLRDEMRLALAQLPDSQRHPIELAYFRGLTQREVAEVLNEPLGTIKTRMRLGMRKLREQMEKRKVELA